MNLSTIHYMSISAKTSPPMYPNNPVNPAAVPAAFFGTRSKALTPISITGPYIKAPIDAKAQL